MWLVGGGLGAVSAAYISYILSNAGMAHLPSFTRFLATLVLLLIALAAGFLAGGVIFRRATRERLHLVTFSAVASAVAGGIIGLSQALALTIGYLSNYATWPSDRLDQVLLLLSYPVFGSLGFMIGAIVGVSVGALLGGVLRVVTPAR